MSEATFSVRKASTLTGIPVKTVAEILATLPDDPSLEQIVAAFVLATRAAGTPANLLNVSQLHRITGLDRTTITKRLAEAGIEPAIGSKQKEKLFDIEGSLGALVTAEGSDMGESKRKKLEGEAGLMTLKLQKEKRELVPIADVREYAFNFVKAMHQRFTRYAKEARRRLKLKPDQVRAMETDIAIIFDDLKRDHPNIF